jgi:hypothetical protein
MVVVPLYGGTSGVEIITPGLANGQRSIQAFPLGVYRVCCSRKVVVRGPVA